jgi:hypothetical protein
VQPLQPLDPLLIEIEAGFAQQHVGEQSAAHADLAMNPPDRHGDPFCLERFAPCQHVLIDAVDERPVEIEDEGGFLTCDVRHVDWLITCCAMASALTHSSEKLLEQRVRGVACAFGGADGETNVVRTFGDLEREEPAAGLFLAHHIANATGNLRGKMQIEVEVAAGACSQAVAHQLRNLGEPVLETRPGQRACDGDVGHDSVISSRPLDAVKSIPSATT